MKKRLMTMLLAGALLVGTVPGAGAASDLDGHWAKDYITYLHQQEVYFPSKTDNTYKPDQKMTRAEFMRYVNRAFHFTETADVSYTDVQKGTWYYDTIRIAEKYGYINGVGNNKMSPLGEITREQAAVIIGRLYKSDPGEVKPSELGFTDKDQIESWSAGYIKAAADKGILAGYTDGSFKPKKTVSRAEVAKVLYYYLGTALSQAGKAYTGADLKSDTDNVTISESCTLTDAKIKGDLYLTEGLGSSAVTLTGVEVGGTIIVSGGTVNMVNTTSDHMVVSSSMGRLLQATATGAAHIADTVVRTPASLYENGLSTAGREGFVNVTVDGEKRVALTLDAAVNALNVENDAAVNTTANAAIHHLKAKKPVSVTGYGSIYQADIGVDGCVFGNDVSLSGYTLADGVSAKVGGKVVTTSSGVGVTPTKATVDVNNSAALGAGLKIAVPSGVTVSSLLCDGSTVDEANYTKNATGATVHTAYLTRLTRGTHTLTVALSDGKRAAIELTVENNSATAETESVTFDRYYLSNGFADVTVRLADVADKNGVRSVVLGLSRLNFSFNAGNRNLVLRRGELAPMPAGEYTLTINLATGGSRKVNLVVTDSTPTGTAVAVAEYDTYAPVDAVFPLDLSTRTVKSVSGVRSGSAKTLTQGTDYTTDARTITLTKAALEQFRVSNNYVAFTATLSDNSTVTLVVDYIA